MRERFVVPSIGSRDVACAQWSNVRRFKHFLYLLDLVNDAFNVHSVSLSNRKAWRSNRSRISKDLTARFVRRAPERAIVSLWPTIPLLSLHILLAHEEG